jgi:DME family drug/metabolite transporter
LGERLSAAVGGALAVSLLGLVLLIGMGGPSAGGPVVAMLPGVLLALAAACCFGAFILVSRLLAPRYHPLLSITIAVTIGAVLLLTIVGLSTGFTLRYPGTVWVLFLYLGLVPTALGYALFYRGVRRTTAAEASIASLTEPLTSTGLALVLFGERLGPLGWLGALLLIGAIVFLYRKGAS